MRDESEKFKNYITTQFLWLQLNTSVVVEFIEIGYIQGIGITEKW